MTTIWDDSFVRGETFRRVLALREHPTGDWIDLAGISFTGQMRTYHNAPGEPVATFAIALVPHPETLEADHAAELVLTDEETAAIPAGEYVTDVFGEDGAGEKRCYFRGVITVHGRATI